MIREHMVPESRGGSSGPENLVPACQRCNTTKRNLTPMEWIFEKAGVLVRSPFGISGPLTMCALQFAEVYKPPVAFTLQLPESLAGEVEASADADSRSRQAQIAVLLREALAARSAKRAK